MKRETVKSFFGKTLIFQILFFVAALFLTIYFFPREEKFRYHFQEGKPWKYGLLTASFRLSYLQKSRTDKKRTRQHSTTISTFLCRKRIDRETTDSKISTSVQKRLERPITSSSL